MQLKSYQASFLNKNVTIIGDVISKGHLKIDAIIQGSVIAPQICILSHGVVFKNVTSCDLKTCGDIRGIIYANHLTIIASPKKSIKIHYNKLHIKKNISLSAKLIHKDEIIVHALPQTPHFQLQDPHVIPSSPPPTIQRYSPVYPPLVLQHLPHFTVYQKDIQQQYKKYLQLQTHPLTEKIYFSMPSYHRTLQVLQKKSYDFKKKFYCDLSQHYQNIHYAVNQSHNVFFKSSNSLIKLYFQKKKKKEQEYYLRFLDNLSKNFQPKSYKFYDAIKYIRHQNNIHTFIKYVALSTKNRHEYRQRLLHLKLKISLYFQKYPTQLPLFFNAKDLNQKQILNTLKLIPPSFPAQNTSLQKNILKKISSYPPNKVPSLADLSLEQELSKEKYAGLLEHFQFDTSTIVTTSPSVFFKTKNKLFFFLSIKHFIRIFMILGIMGMPLLNPAVRLQVKIYTNYLWNTLAMGSEENFPHLTIECSDNTCYFSKDQ